MTKKEEKEANKRRVKTLSGFTNEQDAWLRAESERVGSSISGVVKQMIQERIDADISHE